MKTLEDSVLINVKPEIVWNWLLQFADNYCEWHPSHIKAFWKEGAPNEIGSIMYAEELIENELLKMNLKLTKLIPNSFYEFNTVGSMKILMPRGTFEITPKGNKCIFRATLDFRMGKLLSKIAKKKVAQIKQHMLEEGENLKKILEKS